MTTGFAQFLARTGKRPSEAARATGLHISTICRIRDGQVPDGPTMLLLDGWADAVAAELELEPGDWMDWTYLLEG